MESELKEREENKEYKISILKYVKDHILLDCAPNIDYDYLEKGIIVENDELDALSDCVKNLLSYNQLKKLDKVVEINVDSSWDSFIIKDDGCKFMNKLVCAAREANHGLLIINLYNENAFKRTNYLKKLVKQEYELELWPEPGDSFKRPETSFKFDGYVLFVFNGFTIQEAYAFAENENNGGEFRAFLSFCSIIK